MRRLGSRFAKDGETDEQFATRCAESLEQLILREGPETVAAMFCEPVLGAGGVIVPPRTYYAKIQAVLKKYDVLLVADEVICGFGRTGNVWGSQTLGLVSQSGRFRLRWQTRLEPGRDPASSYFKLTVHSGVSGRALQEVANQRGPGEGAYNLEDDPRPFNLMVESDGLVWSIVADEIVLTRSRKP